MPRIEVEPDALQVGAIRQAEVAGRVLELRGQLDAVSAGAGSAAGDPEAAGAISSCGAGWGLTMGALASSLHQLGGNLGAAGFAYRQVDEGTVPTG
jgi:hypothetical protein